MKPLTPKALHAPKAVVPTPSPLKQNCTICLRRVQRSAPDRTVPECCDHQYHRNCIETWSRTSNTCPTCRKRFRGLLVGPGPNPIRIPVAVARQHNLQDFDPTPNPEDKCRRCGGWHEPGLLLICDGSGGTCQAMYHTFCLGLGDTVPSGRWECPNCQEMEQKMREQELLEEAKDGDYNPEVEVEEEPDEADVYAPAEAEFDKTSDDELIMRPCRPPPPPRTPRIATRTRSNRPPSPISPPGSQPDSLPFADESDDVDDDPDYTPQAKLRCGKRRKRRRSSTSSRDNKRRRVDSPRQRQPTRPGPPRQAFRLSVDHYSDLVGSRDLPTSDQEAGTSDPLSCRSRTSRFFGGHVSRRIPAQTTDSQTEGRNRTSRHFPPRRRSSLESSNLITAQSPPRPRRRTKTWDWPDEDGDKPSEGEEYIPKETRQRSRRRKRRPQSGESSDAAWEPVSSIPVLTGSRRSSRRTPRKPSPPRRIDQGHTRDVFTSLVESLPPPPPPSSSESPAKRRREAPRKKTIRKLSWGSLARMGTIEACLGESSSEPDLPKKRKRRRPPPPRKSFVLEESDSEEQEDSGSEYSVEGESEEDEPKNEPGKYDSEQEDEKSGRGQNHASRHRDESSEEDAYSSEPEPDLVPRKPPPIILPPPTPNRRPRHPAPTRSDMRAQFASSSESSREGESGAGSTRQSSSSFASRLPAATVFTRPVGPSAPPRPFSANLIRPLQHGSACGQSLLFSIPLRQATNLGIQ